MQGASGLRSLTGHQQCLPLECGPKVCCHMTQASAEKGVAGKVALTCALQASF